MILPESSLRLSLPNCNSDLQCEEREWTLPFSLEKKKYLTSRSSSFQYWNRMHKDHTPPGWGNTFSYNILSHSLFLKVFFRNLTSSCLSGINRTTGSFLSLRLSRLGQRDASVTLWGREVLSHGQQLEHHSLLHWPRGKPQGRPRHHHL